MSFRLNPFLLVRVIEFSRDPIWQWIFSAAGGHEPPKQDERAAPLGVNHMRAWLRGWLGGCVAAWLLCVCVCAQA